MPKEKRYPIPARIAMAQKDHRKRALYKAIIAVLQSQNPRAKAPCRRDSMGVASKS